MAELQRPPQEQHRQPGRESEVATFGAQVPMKRAGEPDEIALCFVFWAIDALTYMR